MKTKSFLLISCLVGCTESNVGQDPDPTVDLAMTEQPGDGGGTADLQAPGDLALPFAEGKPLWTRSGYNAETADVAVGPDGSLFMTGRFTSADFGDGTVSAAGNGDGFLIKFDKNGQRLWARTFGRAFADAPNRLAVDKSGNVAVVGYSLRQNDTSSHDAFVAYYASDGVQKYFKTFGGPLATAVDTARSAGFAADGSLYVTGGFEDRIDFGGGTLVAAGSRDIYLLQLSATGAHLLSKRWGFTAYDQSSALAVLPDGDVLITGTGGYPIDFGDGMVGTDNTVDTFLVRLSPQGVARWSKRLHISPYSGVLTAAAPDGSLWFAGDTNRAVDFGGGVRTSPTNRALFSAHYAGSGAHLDSFLIPSNGGTLVSAMAVDSTGQVLLGGQVSGAIDFGLGPTTAAAGSAYFLKHAATGQVRWAHRFGGTGSDQVNGIAVGADNRVAVGGVVTQASTVGTVALSPFGFLLAVTP